MCKTDFFFCSSLFFKPFSYSLSVLVSLSGRKERGEHTFAVSAVTPPSVVSLIQSTRGTETGKESIRKKSIYINVEIYTIYKKRCRFSEERLLGDELFSLIVGRNYTRSTPVFLSLEGDVSAEVPWHQ